MTSKQNKMTFWEHLDELRRCLIYSFLTILLFSIIASFFSENIKDFLMNPIKPDIVGNNKITLVYNDPLSPFFLYMSISFFTGFFFSIPVVMYNILNFVSPAVNRFKVSLFVIVLTFSTALFFTGILFTYKALIPISFSFLISFAGGEEMIFSINNIIHKILLICFCIGLVFQMPIIAFFLAKLSLLSSDFLSKNRRYAILISFIVSAMITPPDFISQIILGVPIIILYEICILIAKAVGRKNDK